MAKKLSAVKILGMVLCLWLLSAHSLPLPAAGAGALAQDVLSTQDQTAVQGEVPPSPGKAKKPSNWVWIISEAAMFIMTSLIILATYSWHLRTMVAKKTRELKTLNALLEQRVEERTAALKKSQEAYKAMYAHAEEERKRTQIALKSEREAIKQNLNFMDMISHEYRTPLSVISSSIELIEKKCLLNGVRELDGDIGKMKLSTQRLIDIFQSALGKERLDTLTPQLQMEEIDIVHALHLAIELTGTTYAAHPILFKEKPGHRIRVMADEKLLVTVLKNILDNACKYSEPGQPVHIRLEDGADHVTLHFIDQGLGIDQDEIGHVFEKYFRSEHTGKRQGAGLGLFLVKTIVDLHGGSVALTSQRHTGTRVSVRLPKQEKERA